MYRRTGIALFLLFGLLAVWMFNKDVTFYRGADVDYRRGTVEHVYMHCGEVVPILFDGRLYDDVPGYLRGTCTRSARSHFAWLILFGGISGGFLIAGLRGVKGMRARPIDSVLAPLPSPEELKIWAYRPGGTIG